MFQEYGESLYRVAESPFISLALASPKARSRAPGDRHGTTRLYDRRG
jgi:hypothetical protein